MDYKRIARHLCTSRSQVARSLPAEALDRVTATIAEEEKAHSGEIVFAVEAGLSLNLLLRGATASERALQIFGEHRVWDTEHNNGVLIYLLLADRHVEIVADRGIDRRVPQDTWERLCREMEAQLSAGNFERAVEQAIRRVAVLLREHFPGGGGNELADEPIVI